MVELLASPFFPKFQEFVSSIETSCLICSPFITRSPVQQLVDVAEQKGVQRTLSVKIVTDISAANLLGGSTELGALLLLIERIADVEIVYLPRIHAKVYVSGESFAIVSSANCTEGGLFRNLEYGVCLSDPNLVLRIRHDIEQYAELGGKVTRLRLLELENRVKKLQSAVQEEQKSINKKLRELSAELRRDTEDELIRVRVHGRSINAIFSETILYLLSLRDMTTVELHNHIRDIHPDFCDDTVDRVIDGQHFGKLWKHQVRNSQQHLKQRGLIEYDSSTRLWKRIK